MHHDTCMGHGAFPLFFFLLFSFFFSFFRPTCAKQVEAALSHSRHFYGTFFF